MAEASNKSNKSGVLQFIDEEFQKATSERLKTEAVI